MKRASIFWHLLWLGSFMVFLSGCSSLSPQGVSVVASPSAQSAQTSPTLPARAEPSRAIQLLRPDAPVPASCPLTPVYTGGPFGENIPWLRAQPVSAGIVAYLAYSGVGTTGTYRLPPAGGVFVREGLYTKTLWAVDNALATDSFLIDGTHLPDTIQTFHDTGNAMFGPGLPTGAHMHTYTSYLQAPSVGCWRLRVTTGQASATITMWFAS
jgi:hypothetical protein